MFRNIIYLYIYNNCIVKILKFQIQINEYQYINNNDSTKFQKIKEKFIIFIR